MRPHPRPFRRRPMMLLALCAVLGACGQTGPLYLPDQVPESEKPPSQRNKERAQGKPATPQPAPAPTAESTAPVAP